MTNFIKILFISLFIFTFTSCKKEPKMHEVGYFIEFIETPDYGQTNWLELSVAPVYDTEYNKGSQFPAITPEIASVNGEWRYDYLELVEGDKITFGLWTAKGYYYRLYVYIDGVQVSSKRVYTGGSFTDVDEQTGIDDDPTSEYIVFTYSE